MMKRALPTFSAINLSGGQPDHAAMVGTCVASASFRRSRRKRTFANLKDVIELPPIYHRTDQRVQAHLFVAALAFLLHRAIEKKLKAAQLDPVRHRGVASTAFGQGGRSHHR